MALLELLRVLDHPKAVCILQKRFSRNSFHNGQNECGVESSVLNCDSMVDLCGHCNHTVNFCTSLQLSFQNSSASTNLSQSHCSMSTLQDLVTALSTPSSISVKSLSSIALHNILVLIEQNIECFQLASVESFLLVVEESFIQDEWCKFLVNCIKKRVGILVSCPLQETELVDKGQDGVGVFREHNIEELECGSESSGTLESDEPMEGIEHSSVRNSEDLIVDEDGENELRKNTVDNTIEPSPEAADVSTEHKTLVAKICDDWSLCKPTEQASFELLCSLGNNQFSACAKKIDGSRLSLPCIAGICKNISSLKTELSYHNSTVITQTVILPIILSLSQTASRDVISGLCMLNSTYPDCLTQALVLPLIQHQNFGSFHSNLIIKVLEDSATKQQLENVWRCLVDSDKDNTNAGVIWTEDMIGVALFLIQQKVTLDSQLASNLVGLLQRTSASLCKSSKFAKLIVELCKSQNYTEQMVQFKVELLEMAEGHKSILKSALLREVKKL